MIKYYYIGDEGGGGGNPPAAPAGYVLTTPQMRADWNSFLDYAGKQNADFKDPKAGANLLAQYKKQNPNFSITPQQVAHIQYEQYQLRKGDSFGGLKPEQLKYLRQGMQPNYLERPLGNQTGTIDANTAKLYYPNMGSYGTDLERYVNEKTGVTPETPRPAPAPVATNPAPITPAPAGAIPRPNYSDSTSRLAYAQAFKDKYGKNVLDGYGDIPLRVNEKAQWASDTSKNLVNKEAQRLGLDPALLYSSAMIEGMSGYYPQKNKETGGETVKWTGDKDYPISGLWGFGLDSLEDYLPALKKKGYLPQDFDKNVKFFEGEGGPMGKNINESAMFKTVDAGLQAKAAMMRQYFDEFDEHAKEKGIKLTPEQRNFFALAHFNSGSHGYEMLDAYNKAGLLKNNDFIKKQPQLEIPDFVKFYKGDKAKAERLHKQIFNNVSPRLAAAKGLKEEGLF